jgi:hypothetical protein
MKAYLRVITETFFGCGKGASDLMKSDSGESLTHGSLYKLEFCNSKLTMKSSSTMLSELGISNKC